MNLRVFNLPNSFCGGGVDSLKQFARLIHKRALIAAVCFTDGNATTTNGRENYNYFCLVLCSESFLRNVCFFLFMKFSAVNLCVFVQFVVSKCVYGVNKLFVFHMPSTTRNFLYFKNVSGLCGAVQPYVCVYRVCFLTVVSCVRVCHLYIIMCVYVYNRGTVSKRIYI